MVLSQAAKYSLRAVIHLAEHAPEARLSRDIAEAIGVPAQYLAKILQDLARSGLLHSAKGRGGGFRLAKPAAEIDLLQVVHAVDGERFACGCFLGLPECSEESPCQLHEQWGGIRDAFVAMLKSKRLPDVFEDPRFVI